MQTKFSVLMSIYNQEKAIYFNRAMQSIWDEQTLKPDEIILVEDGKLTAPLYQNIDVWANKLGEKLTIVPLKHHVGISGALNAGLQKCRYEIIARMDSDDIALKDRFAKQLAVFKNHSVDIVSSWVGEFDKTEDNIVSYRKLPQYHNQIIKFSKKRSPINHPAVMYKKSIIKNAGNYPCKIILEDYYLCVKAALAGAKFYNIQQPLVNTRIGHKHISRRSGWQYALGEYQMQKKCFQLGYINFFEFIRNISLRFIVRIMPRKIVTVIYKILRR